jgi:hypothetical protein
MILHGRLGLVGEGSGVREGIAGVVDTRFRWWQVLVTQ